MMVVALVVLAAFTAASVVAWKVQQGSAEIARKGHGATVERRVP
jgi:hypothetical protein